jgi:hypothetical protein
MRKKLKATLWCLPVFTLAMIYLVTPCLAQSAKPKLARIVYITNSKACGCMAKIAKDDDRLIAEIFDSSKQPIERLDIVKDQEGTKGYIRDYHLYVVPALLFLDQGGTLLACIAGEMKKDDILAKLNQFGG